MSLVASEAAPGAFSIHSWPDTKTLPVGPGQTPPGQCVTTAMGTPHDGAALVMKAQGPHCIAFQAQSLFGLATSLVVAWPKATASPSQALCLDRGPAPPPPPPPPFSGVTCDSQGRFAGQPYCNRSLPLEQRVFSIVSQMTVSEKIAMMDSGNPGVGRLGIRPFQFGEGLHGVDSNCGVAVGEPDEFGVRTGCPTSYPSGIAEGATFNKSLWLTVGAADGREGRALHNQADGTPAGQAPAGALSGHGLAAIAFWAPDMNLFRDPRWGRGQEVPGEDPVLTSEYVKHFSQGLMYGDTQHGDVDPNHLQILSTCKHFAGYDIETGRSSNDVSISPRMLTEYYLPVFKTCIQVAKVKSMMCSYNAVNGVPSCANGKFQNELVREQWGWDGFIVSDCGAIGNIQTQHHYAATAEDAVADAVRGGTDLECDSFYKEYLQSTIAKGKLAVSDLDTAVSRILTHFVSLGELEGPEDVVYQNYGPEMVDTTEHRRLALSVAEQAMTLLKNDPPTGSSEPLLPLNRHQSIALIGPQANFTLEMLSNYEGQNTLVLNHSTLMVAMRQGLNVTYAVGHSLDVSNTSTALIPEAVAAAKAAEVAVVMVGLCADHCTGNGRTENEGNDRGPNGTGWKDLGLPGAQQQLLEAVVAAQPRTVLVMQNGGMLSISWAKERVPAILEAYYPGELGGDAIVRTLLGSNNPGGKTPVTWYPSTILQRDMHDMDVSVVVEPPLDGGVALFRTGSHGSHAAEGAIRLTQLGCPTWHCRSPVARD